MQAARFRQADISLVEINNVKSMSPAVSSGEERGFLSRTAAGNRAYWFIESKIKKKNMSYMLRKKAGFAS